jgi:peptide/nickel transport system substrate-binding protein
MNVVRWILLVATAVLLVYMAVDRWREPQQLERVSKSLDRLDLALQELARTQKQLADNMAKQSAGTPVVTGTNPTPIITPTTTPNFDPSIQDGNPKLGVNFLLPYDRSHYNPAWQGGTLKSFSDTPKRLNPLTDNSATSRDVHDRCNEALCDRPAKHPEQWSAQLAESAVISDDYKTYTFSVRKGIRWTRPACATQPEFAWLNKDVELTAHDFKFQLDMILNPAVDCPALRNYYEDVDRCEVIDDYTFKIYWKRKVYTSLSASLGLAPLPRHIYGFYAKGEKIPDDQIGVAFNKHWFDDQHGVVGVGMFILDRYEPDKIMVFRRNPDYWGAPLHFDKLEWNLEIKKPDAQLIAFKNGQAHAYGLPPLKYKSEILDRKEPRFAAFDATNPKAGRAGELGWERVKQLSFSYLGWNMRRPLFQDKRVRQAMSHLFPKQRIIDEVFFGLGQPVLADAHPDSQYYNQALQPYEYNVEKARALLQDAGWSDSDGDGILDKAIDGKSTKFSFMIKYYQDSPEWDSTLLIFKNELRRVGIELDPKPFEWKELIRAYEDKDFDAVVGGWRMDWDIDYYQLWHSSQADVQGGSNHCGFKNARVDQLADELRLTFETDKRIAIAKEIQSILHYEQPYTFFRSSVGIFIWQNHGKPAQDLYLKGVTEALDTLNPLVNRSSIGWHFR